MERGGSVYTITNKCCTTLYIGITSDLQGRFLEHTSHLYSKSFTAKYNLNMLTYYKSFVSIEEAISRQKELKEWVRKRKNILIDSFNSTWKDLSSDISEW